jgi:hypothetical protein
MADDGAHARRVLRRIRWVHTIAWAVFASAIVAIPPAIFAGRLELAAWLSLLVWVEVVTLLFNRMRCPLTGVAERYTDDRSDAFDIYLPGWLARHNKSIFGTFFAFAELWLFWRWWPG